MPLTRPKIWDLDTNVSFFTDAITVLHQGATSADTDVGFLFNRANGLVSNVALYWSESGNAFVTGFTSNTGTNYGNIVTTSYANLKIGSLITVNGAAIEFASGAGIKISGSTGGVGQVLVASGTGGLSWGPPGAFTGGYVIGPTSFGSNLVANSTTISSSTTTGALVVVGGAGISGNLNAGTASLTAGQHQLLSGAQYAPTVGTFLAGAHTVLSGSGGNYLALGQYPVGGATGNHYAQWIQSGYPAPAGAVYYPMILNPLGGNVIVGSTTASTSYSTGALVVNGGLGINGNVNSSGSAGFSGVFNENTTTAGIFLGNAGTPGGVTPRAGFFNGNSSQNWQIDNWNGTFRWFTPGVERMKLDGNTGQLTVPSTVQSSSTTTGALVVAGGAGIAGNLYVGGNLIVSNVTYENQEVITTTEVVRGNIVAASGTASTNTTTGALVVTGGAGVSGALNVGTSITSTSITVNGTFTGNTAYADSDPGNYDAEQVITFSNQNNITGVSFSPTDRRVLTLGLGPVRRPFLRTGSGVPFELATGNVLITSTTVTSSNVTGALVVSGGIGVSGSINIGTGLVFSKADAATISKPTTGRIDLANAGGLDANNPFWSGYHFSTPDTITVNGSAGYPRMSMYWNYNSITNPNNINFNMVAGNNATGGNANVTLGTDTAGYVRFVTSNTERLKVGGEGNVVITATTASSSTTTGALVIAGGIGIAGGVNMATGQYLDLSNGSGTRIARDGGINGMRLDVGSSLRMFVADSTGNVAITSTTASSSTTTGALVVAGGVGVAGNIVVGGSGIFWSNSTPYGSSGINATNDTITTTLYPVMVAAAGTAQTPKVTTGKLVFNASTGSVAVGGTDFRGILTVQKDFTSTYAANTDPSDTGRPFVMQNNSTTLAANQYSTITLQIAPTSGLPGGRVLGDLRLIRESINSTNSFFMLSAFRQDGTYKDFFKIGYDSSYHVGNLNIGYTADQGYKLAVNGSFAATTKSFLIPHPTKPGKKLRYGSLEGPENGVYVRGRLTGNNTIELPEYWTKLVDPASITVNLTPIGRHQNLYVIEADNTRVVVGNSNLISKGIDCYYTVYGERCDVDKLDVECD